MSSFQPDASHIVLLCLSRVAELEKNFFSICAWSPIGMVLHKGLLPLGDVGVDVGLLRRAVAPLPVLLGVHHQHRRCSSRSKDVSKKLRKNHFFQPQYIPVIILPVITRTRRTMTTMTTMRIREFCSSGMGARSMNTVNFCSTSRELPELILRRGGEDFVLCIVSLVSHLDRVDIFLVRPAHIHYRQVHLVVVPGELEVSIRVSCMFLLLKSHPIPSFRCFEPIPICSLTVRRG